MSYFARTHEPPKWAAQVPKGWSSNWLKWSVDLSTKHPTEEEQEALPYIANEDIASWTGKLLIQEPKPSEADSRTFRENDVLFNKLRPYLAKIFHATFDGVSSGELLCLRPSHVVEPRFLFFVLVSNGFIDTINAETFGAKMPRADWDTVGHQPLPLPPLDTQRRIARFLDEKTTQIDKLIEEKRELLDRLSEKRQALITRAVTKGLKPEAPMKFSAIDWLGDIPAHWDVIALNKVTTKITNGYVGPTRDIFVPEGVPYIQSLHIKGNRILFMDDFYVTNDWSNQHAKSVLSEGDVLIVQTGDIGQVAHVTAEHVGCNCHALIICSPKPGLLIGEFLSWALCSDYGQQFLHLVKTGALHPHLNCGKVKFFPVLIPPLKEQAEINAEVRQRIHDHREAETQIELSMVKLKEYRAAMITSAVTGQIAELQ